MVALGLCLGQRAGHRADCKVLTDVTVCPRKSQGTDSRGGSGERSGVLAYLTLPMPFTGMMVEDTGLNQNSRVKSQLPGPALGPWKRYIHGPFFPGGFFRCKMWVGWRGRIE